MGPLDRVPGQRALRSRTPRRCGLCGGSEGSNLVCSSKESANFRSLSGGRIGTSRIYTITHDLARAGMPHEVSEGELADVLDRHDEKVLAPRFGGSFFGLD